MSTILPEGDAARKAVRWISEMLRDDPDQPLQPLVARAAARFDLSPRETEQLAHFYRSGKEQA